MRNLQLRRWKTLRRVNIDQELGRLYGGHVRFRGKQREAVDVIIMNKSPVIVIMGTGTGKSLCFMLPAASCPGGLTVVIVLLVSLQGDLIDRCRKLKISYTEWRSDRVPGDVSIVFVTPESAMTKCFLDFLESRRVMAKVDRIVVDECYTIMEGSLTLIRRRAVVEIIENLTLIQRRAVVEIIENLTLIRRRAIVEIIENLT
jgi:superfamily II DNA helicase RecQ